jgi:hypothetical protein
MAFLSGGAGVVHSIVAGRHFQEWWVFGTFFVVAAAAQMVWSVAVLTWPSRALLIVAVAGNLAIVGIWTVSRASGLPLGPDAGRAEPVGALDVVAGCYEIGLASFGLFALRHTLATVDVNEGLQNRAVFGVAALVVAGVSLAIFGVLGH